MSSYMSDSDIMNFYDLSNRMASSCASVSDARGFASAMRLEGSSMSAAEAERFCEDTLSTLGVLHESMKSLDGFREQGRDREDWFAHHVMNNCGGRYNDILKALREADPKSAAEADLADLPRDVSEASLRRSLHRAGRIVTMMSAASVGGSDVSVMAELLKNVSAYTGASLTPVQQQMAMALSLKTLLETNPALAKSLRASPELCAAAAFSAYENALLREELFSGAKRESQGMSRRADVDTGIAAALSSLGAFDALRDFFSRAGAVCSDLLVSSLCFVRDHVNAAEILKVSSAMLLKGAWAFSKAVGRLVIEGVFAGVGALASGREKAKERKESRRGTEVRTEKPRV